MIEYRFARERELLLEYAKDLGNAEALSILTRGTIVSAADAETLAKFFWQMIDASVADDIESWLERIHTTLFIAFRKAGYADIWNEELSRA